MSNVAELANTMIIGEFVRRMDDRYRISLPRELVDRLLPEGQVDCVLAKERSGALSLWSRPAWEQHLASGIRVVAVKLKEGRLSGRIEQVQTLGRLLSSRFHDVKLAGRGRLLVPEGFREFLGVKPNGQCIVVGAGVAIELWQPDAWRTYLQEKIAEFSTLVNELV